MRRGTTPTTRWAGCAITGLIATLALAGCSGGSAAPAPTASATGQPSGPSASVSPSASASAAESLCTVISVQRMSRLTGFSLAAATDSSQSGARSCTYTPTEASKKTDVALIIGDGTLKGGIGTAAENAKSSFGLTRISTTSVDGADGARLVTGKVSGVTTVFVIATKGGTYYSALTGGSRTADVYGTAMRKVLAVLITG